MHYIVRFEIQTFMWLVSDDLIGPDEDLTGVAVEEEEAENELHTALSKARKLKQRREKKTAVEKVGQIYRYYVPVLCELHTALSKAQKLQQRREKKTALEKVHQIYIFMLLEHSSMNCIQQCLSYKLHPKTDSWQIVRMFSWFTD